MNFTQRLIAITEPEVWEKKLSHIPHLYTHTHWYNQAMQTASGRDVFLYAGETDNFRIVCPLTLRKKASVDYYDVTTPYGFSGFCFTGEYANFNNEFQQFLTENQFVCGHIALHPLLPMRTDLAENDLFSGKKSYCLNLKPDLDNIFGQFSHGHQYTLKKLQKLPLAISTDKDQATFNKFIELYESSLQRNQAADVYHFGTQAWAAILASPHCHVVSIRVEGNIEAIGVFIFYNHIADYFAYTSTVAGRTYAKTILWEAIKAAKKQSVHWLHLGCGVRENDSLEQFKANFGGEARTTYALKQIYNQPQYQYLCEKYDSNPHDISGYFPSYWAVKNS